MITAGSGHTSSVGTTPHALRMAAAVIAAGGVVAYPTEAVYGLGCDPLDAGAVRRILAINIAGAGLFLQLIAAAYQGLFRTPDPVPHALVLTGIVVAFSATALALALGRRLQQETEDE